MADQTLDWTHRLDEIDSQSRNFEVTATPKQCGTLAESMGLLSVKSFSAAYQMRTLQSGEVELVGTFSATGEQACVITLEPVAFNLQEDVSVTFVPAGIHVHSEHDIEHEALALDDTEPYNGDRVDVGKVFFEHFGAALDPYPRLPGAVWNSAAGAKAGQDEETHPFAVLRKLGSSFKGTHD